MADIERSRRRGREHMFDQCHPRDAIERYAGGTYMQHNPGVAEEGSFIAYFEKAARAYPGKRVEVASLRKAIT